MVGAGREAKRRRKTLGKFKKYFECILSALHFLLYCILVLFLDTEAGEKAAKEEAVVENATPDYAAGLVSTQVVLEILSAM